MLSLGISGISLTVEGWQNEVTKQLLLRIISTAIAFSLGVGMLNITTVKREKKCPVA